MPASENDGKSKLKQKNENEKYICRERENWILDQRKILILTALCSRTTLSERREKK